MVGVAGFEPATPSSRTRCATRLRHTPPFCGPAGQCCGHRGLSGVSNGRKAPSGQAPSFTRCGSAQASLFLHKVNGSGRPGLAQIPVITGVWGRSPVCDVLTGPLKSLIPGLFLFIIAKRSVPIVPQTRLESSNARIVPSENFGIHRSGVFFGQRVRHAGLKLCHAQHSGSHL